MKDRKVIPISSKPKKVTFRTQEQITEANRKIRKEILARFDSQAKKNDQ